MKVHQNNLLLSENFRPKSTWLKYSDQTWSPGFVEKVPHRRDYKLNLQIL